jgi:tRNA threonylcarbamoyl adenosine modification protein YjeE
VTGEGAPRLAALAELLAADGFEVRTAVDAAGVGTVGLTVDDPERMHEFGRLVGSRLEAGDVVLLTGDLGAGKTTFTRGLGEGLGVRGPVTSPTFVLARTHPSLVAGPPLVHVDAYRLGSALELDDLDIDFVRSVVVVEWGAGMLEALADSWLSITIDRPHGAGDWVVGDGDEGGDGDGSGDGAVDGLEPIEPRQIGLLGVGPGWERGA